MAAARVVVETGAVREAVARAGVRAAVGMVAARAWPAAERVAAVMASARESFSPFRLLFPLLPSHSTPFFGGKFVFLPPPAVI